MLPVPGGRLLALGRPALHALPGWDQAAGQRPTAPPAPGDLSLQPRAQPPASAPSAAPASSSRASAPPASSAPRAPTRAGGHGLPCLPGQHVLPARPQHLRALPVVFPQPGRRGHSQLLLRRGLLAPARPVFPVHRLPSLYPLATQRHRLRAVQPRHLLAARVRHLHRVPAGE